MSGTRSCGCGLAAAARPRRSAATALRGVLAALAAAQVLCHPGAAVAQDVTAVTAGGTLAGSASASDATISVFRGVRYGEDTGGDNRFLPPRPVADWDGVRDATALGDRCIGAGYPPFLMPEEGADLDTSPMSEDCLFLNLWTPATDDGKRAVMVWLHGGGFTAGSGGSVRYDGTNLAARQDVVVVTLNHRLGALGFMDLSAAGGVGYADSGNAGMLDIVLALQWVRDNVAAFGGDPARVMVFGESGGGSKATTLLSMPAAQGLFHAVAAQSGLNDEVIAAADAQATAATAMTGLGAASLDDLLALDGEAVFAAEGSWGPVAGPSLPRGPFQPDADPLSLAVPLLVGSNRTEANFFAMTPLDPVDDAALREAFGQIPFTRGIAAERIGPLLAGYGAAEPGVEPYKLLQLIATDAWLTQQVQMAADARATAGAATWVYNFAMPQGARDGKLDAPHTAEIAYVFDNLDLSTALVGTPDDADRALATAMSTAWANFAKTARPTAPGLPDWPQWRTGAREVMLFDGETRVVQDPYGARLGALADAMK